MIVLAGLVAIIAVASGWHAAADLATDKHSGGSADRTAASAGANSHDSRTSKAAGRTVGPRPSSTAPSRVPAPPVTTTAQPNSASNSPTQASVDPPAPVRTGPDPLSSGASGSLPLKTGDVWVKQSSIANLHITGSLYITGSNVSITNVAVDGTVYINATPTGGMVSPVPSNVTLRRLSATNMFSNGFDGLTLDAVQLVNTHDGPHAQLFNYQANGVTYPASNLVIENSWFHGLLPSTTDAHVENLHLGGVQRALIRNNEFDMIAPDANTRQYITASVDLETQMYGVFNSDIVFADNVVRGGGYYQLYFCAAGSNSVSGNRFYRSGNTALAAVQYPPSSYSSASLPNGRYVPFAQSDNELDNRPVSLTNAQ